MTAVKEQCPEFPFFGAGYPDATCIDGYLWDLDSCDEPGGSLSSGGETPCPFCNSEKYMAGAVAEQAETLICDSWDDEKDCQTITDQAAREKATAQITAWMEGIKKKWGT